MRTHTRRTVLAAVGASVIPSSVARSTADRGEDDDIQTRGTWSSAPALPRAQSDAAGGVVDGVLYYFGGFTSGVDTDPVSRGYKFDPAAGSAGTWSRIPDAPRALWGSCGVAAEGTVYSFGGAPADSPYGGVPPSDEIFGYDPGDGWTDLTAERGVRCPYRNWAMRGVYNSSDGLIYCVGGGTEVTDRESASTHGVGGNRPGTFDESRVWTFDPETEEVVDADLTRLPRAKRWPSVALVSVEGRPCLHAIAGRFGSSGPTDSNFRYDIECDEWSEMTSAPLTGNYGTNSDPVIGNTVYLTHGITLAGELSLDIYRPFSHAYDPEEDAFATDVAQPSHPRTGPVDAVIDETLHVVGGHVKRYDRKNEHDCTTYHEKFSASEK